jgi:Fe-S-cluster-containing hydrogenase component 2
VQSRTGCQNCVPACPFDVIEMQEPVPLEDAVALPEANREIGVATKCDRCLTTRQKPPCVTACPYGAAQRGTPQELFPGLKKWEEGLIPR